MSKNIMFVDNSVSALESFKWVLKDEACHSFVFDNPSEALKIIEEKQFDVVVFDQSMPEMGGIDFLEKVKAKSPDTAGIIMGCSNDLEEVGNIINQGYDYILVEKPWDTKKLQRALEMAVIKYKISIETKKVPADIA